MGPAMSHTIHITKPRSLAQRGSSSEETDGFTEQNPKAEVSAAVCKARRGGGLPNGLGNYGSLGYYGDN